MSNAPGTPDEYEFAPMEVEAVPPPPTVYEPPTWNDGISYRTVPGHGRPGGLTAIGVLSVVLGAFSILASLGYGSWQFGMLMLGHVQRSMATSTVGVTPPTPTPPTVAAPVPATPTSTGTPMLTHSEQQAAVVRVLILGGRMNPTQRMTLMRELRTPGQQLLVPTGGNTSAPENQIVAATNLPDGSLRLQTMRPGASNTLVISPTGAVTESTATTWSGSSNSTSNWSTSSTVTSGAVTVTGSGRPVTPANIFAGKHLDEAAASMALSMTALNGMLAIFLIVAGVMMLRNNPHAARLHRIYAVLKLPIGLLAAIGTGWLWSSFMTTIAANGGANPGPIVGFIMAIPAILGLIYPAVLLGVMHSRWVHQWYGEA